MNQDLRFWLEDVFTLAGIAAGGIRWWTWRARQQSARSWPVAKGHIESATARRSEHGEPGQHVVILVYSYSAGQDYYAGTYIRPFWKRSRAERFVARLKGSSLAVRYRADHPGTSAVTDDVIQALRLSTTGVLQTADVDAFRAPPLR